MSASALPRLLAGADPRGGAPLATHLAHHGMGTLAIDAAWLVAEVERAGLRGRGGAGFPTATKLDVVGHGRRRPVVVANGSEGEPASAKDATLLTQVPHLVLDGLQLAAAATGADTAFLCAKGSGTGARDVVEHALAERAAARRDAVPVQVVSVPDGYVSGEESALVSLLNGGRALPTAVPPRPFERGVHGRPTLIQNVETLAQVALIARHGADWYREIGTPAESGSALVTLRGAVERPGVCEIALGTSLSSLVAHGGGDLARSRGVLVGGYFGTWLDAGAAHTAALDGATLRPLGASLGCGVVAVLPHDACPVAETARVVRWLAGESAGQCGPCVFGLAAVADALERVAGGCGPGRREDDPLRRVRRWCGEIAGRGACRHPDGAARLVASALRTFEADFEDHVRHGRCDACARASVLPLPAHETMAAAA
ncbi:MAG: NADH-ubiquinone oxidoreductase-F iron-sulfur binding region domain-containing protein [Conexibacter sp.]